MEVDAIKGNVFSGRLIYMYPSDTVARLIRKVSGELHDTNVVIVKSEEIYRMDPRSHSFWSDCSQCAGKSSFHIENGDLILEITASACGDSCNGETVFRRKMQDYNAGMQTALVKEFGPDKAPPILASYAADIDTSGNPPGGHRDSLKYFPNLLNDSMGIHFDPNKYALPNKPAKDTVLTAKQQAALNKAAKQNKAATKHTTLKDSVAINKKAASNNVINTPATKVKAITKPAMKDSTAASNKALEKDTIQATAIHKNQAAANKQNATPPATQKDSAAILPTPKKDTVPAAITERPTNLVTTYHVSSPHIVVQLLDDGQIDGDAVSVYYNGKVIINNQTLTHKAVTFTLEASAASRHHEFILISESEGFLPPNTALMRIKAGSQQFELNVSSSSARNAKIAIDYTGE